MTNPGFNPRWLLASLVILAAAVSAYLLINRDSEAVLGQQSDIPGCSDCVFRHEWPAFTAIYQTHGSEVHSHSNVYRPQQIRQLDYTDEQNWRITVLYSDPIETVLRTSDKTGSWYEQSGQTYTKYDAEFDHTTTYTLDYETTIVIPDVFDPTAVSGIDVDTRTDAQMVSTDAEVCTGDDCHVIGTSLATQARQYSELTDWKLTNDALGIPLEVGDTRVLYLQVKPTEPPVACETNLRTVYGSRSVTGQSSCSRARPQAPRTTPVVRLTSTGSTSSRAAG